MTEAAGQGGFAADLRDELEREPPAEARVIAYRICQEAVTDVRMHAAATRVAVRLGEAQGGLLVTIDDAGAGFDPDRVRATPRPGHVGLTSMSERDHGRRLVQVDSHHPGAGTTVRFWLPTKDPG